MKKTANMAQYQRAYYERNKDKVAETQRAYRERNKDKVAEYQRAYRERNKDKVAETQRAAASKALIEDAKRRAKADPLNIFLGARA